MKLLVDEPNPNNVLEIRELNFCPKNWTKIKLGNNSWNFKNDVELIRKWIYNNLHGRFCIVQDLDVINNKMESIIQIGFEEASESTMFSLACSHLHDRDINII